MKKYRVLIIDGDHLMFRCMFQGGLRKLTHTYKGSYIPTGIIKGVLTSLNNYVKRFDPDTVYWCVSGGTCNFRREIYPDYKNKSKDDFSFQTINESAGEEFSNHEMLTTQRHILSSILPDFGIRVMSAPGFEADDCGLYTGYMYLRDPANFDVTLLSDDWDWAQIVHYGGSIYRARQDEMVTMENFVEKTGVSSEAFVYLKALKGDTSDRIPPVVKGLGEKTAMKLLIGMQEKGLELTMDSILDNCQDFISVKQSLKLKDARDNFIRNLLLISMNGKVMKDIQPYLESSWRDGEKFDYVKASAHLQDLSMSSMNDILIEPAMLKLK